MGNCMARRAKRGESSVISDSGGKDLNEVFYRSSGLRVDHLTGLDRTGSMYSNATLTSTNVLTGIDVENTNLPPDDSQTVDEIVAKIISCFPFPSPCPSPISQRKSRFNRRTISGYPRTSESDGNKKLGHKKQLLSAKKGTGRSTSNINFADLSLVAPCAKKNPDKRSSCIEAMILRSVDLTVPVTCDVSNFLRRRLRNFTQLCGHYRTIVPATEHTLWKQSSDLSSKESDAYAALMKDALAPYVPKFYQRKEKCGKVFLELEDLTRGFEGCPGMMDIKMGTRTFLESEVTNPQKRPDLYQKMLAVCPDAATPEERQEGAITKLRYMQFRESESTSASLGFRVEAIKPMNEDTAQKDLKKVKTREQVQRLLSKFLAPAPPSHITTLQKRLVAMRDAIEASNLMQTHEVIGSSILIIYDSSRVSAWMIDFAKCSPVPQQGLCSKTPRAPLSHRVPWSLGNHEDGYLTGLDNLICILDSLPLDNNSQRQL